MTISNTFTQRGVPWSGAPIAGLGVLELIVVALGPLLDQVPLQLVPGNCWGSFRKIPMEYRRRAGRYRRELRTTDLWGTHRVHGRVLSANRLAPWSVFTKGNLDFGIINGAIKTMRIG
jgi:hypothetical protein